MSIVSGLAVLLFISVAINILAMIYCVYQLRGKLTQCHCVSGGDGDNVDQMYEQVDEKQHHTGAVAMKRNEAYGQLQISSFSPGAVSMKRNEAYGQLQISSFSPTTTTGL